MSGCGACTGVITNDDVDVDALAARAQGGDQQAFGMLVRRLVRPALAAAWEFVRTREDAEDVMQDAFARAWRDLARYDAARPFAPWFFTILRNTARNATRRDRRWSMISLTDDVSADEPRSAGDALDSLDRLHLAGRIHAALDELSPMQRACFRLTEIEGFGSAEAGEMLGVSDATVRVPRASRPEGAASTARRGARRGAVMSRDRHPGTRLPDDPAYWEELAARSVDAAFGASDPWWRGISDAAFMLAASAVLALFGGSLLLDERPERATTDASVAAPSPALAAALAPDDPLLASLLAASAGPPSTSTLLELVALREEER